MSTLRHIRSILVMCTLSICLQPTYGLEEPSPAGPKPVAARVPRDGQRDFDFEEGRWKFHLKRLVQPLTGSNKWEEFDGITVTRRIWDGRAFIEECEIDGPTGHIEGLTLRLYNPQTHQWSLYWANSKDGTMSGPPNVGEFKDGRGEFLCQDTFNGRVILTRYVWSDITPNSAHFEQSFSDDGGKTWEVNWITDQIRLKPETTATRVSPAAPYRDTMVASSGRH